MPTNELACWKCGNSVAYLLPPIGRREVCRSCGADLHVCKLCIEYDRSYANACKEPIAEEVRDKERANFCDFFKPRPNAYVAPDSQSTAAAKSALDELFKK